MPEHIKGAAPSPGVKNLSPYTPGLSIAEIKERYGLPQVIKMASNENPLGVSPLAREAIEKNAAFAFRYPQAGNPELVRAIAKKHGISPENIVVGNGSDELIDLLIRVFASNPCSNIICADPCFTLYPIQAQINGTEIRKVPLNNDFSFNFSALLEKADQNTALVFLTTPDNPSGFCPPAEEIEEFLANLSQKAPNALLAIDEAYMDFAEEKKYSLLAQKKFSKNLVFLRTFSKSYGLAGLRIGYLVIHKDLAQWLWRARLPFSLNILAEKAAVSALEDAAFHEQTLQTVKNGRAYLTRELGALGCRVFPSCANFIMVSLPSDSIASDECHEKLLRLGIIIRKLDSYNLPEMLRISIGTQQENRLLVNAMRKILSSPNV